MKHVYFGLVLMLLTCLGFTHDLQVSWHGPPTAVKRAQDPQAPFPYQSKDVTFLNSYDNVNLAGTLTSPKREGRFPAVVLLTGSGPQNRDEELSGHKPFAVLSDYLSRQDIVVLRYDDRGVGESGGQFDNSTIGDFSKDALAALAFLKKQNQVDPHKIGIIGHSEGGLIATLLSGQQVPDLSFIISLAGPAISINNLMVDQLYAIGRASGMSAGELSAARKINERNFSVVKSTLNTREAYEAILDNMKFLSGAKGSSDILAMVSPAYRYFMRIEPERYVKEIKVPVFAAFGSLDVQVPATANLESLYRLLPQNPKSVLKEYEGLNHLFQQAETGLMDEYATIDETFNERVMHDMATWVLKL